jgi:hypothetical protein
MSRALLCARPGCGGAAVAWLTYDYASSSVWLDDEPGGSGDQWGMCADHAARLRAPRGWAMVDRRVGRRPMSGYPTTLTA